MGIYVKELAAFGSTSFPGPFPAREKSLATRLPLGVATFGEQNSFVYKELLRASELLSEIKNEQHKIIKKRTTFHLDSICIDCVS